LLILGRGRMGTLDIILLVLLVCSALATVLIRSLLRSGIALAFTSAVLSMIIFRLDSPFAAVFELSVCAGLICVLFISTISLTEPRSNEEKMQHAKERLHKFWFLPLIVIVIGVILSQMNKGFNIPLPAPEVQTDMRLALWHLRSLDVLGQVIVLLVGVFGVVILFKEKRK